MPFDSWFRLVLNLLVIGMAGYYWMLVRQKRRELRELAAMRAMVETNLRHAERLLSQIESFAGDDDDAAPPPLQ